MGRTGLFVCGLLLGVVPDTWAADPCVKGREEAPAPPPSSNVRPTHDPSRLRELLASGLVRSATFRGLVASLDASDAIVHVSFESSPKLRSFLAHTMAATPSHRYLRVVISIRQSDEVAIPLLAHELQHVMEVVQSRHVVDAAGMTALFEQIGYPVLKGSDVRETEAALQVQRRVKAELSESTGRCTTWRR
jgi:hypothetical protein